MFVSTLLVMTATLGSVSAARADLLEASKARKNMVTMSADYLQRRTTLISKKPLEARGKLYYRAKPAVVTLHVSQPRASVIRLTPSAYEVYRPKRDTLERFALKKQTWTTLLTQTMSAQIKTLEEHFVIVRSALKHKSSDKRTIVLKPREKKLAQRISELELVLDTKRYLLHRVSFTEASGDRVSFELRKHVLNLKLAKSLFAIPLKKSTQVITHK